MGPRVVRTPVSGPARTELSLSSEVAPKALTSFVQNDIGCQQRL